MNGIQEVGGSTPPGSTITPFHHVPCRSTNTLPNINISPYEILYNAVQSRTIPHEAVGQTLARLAVAKVNAFANRGKHSDGGGLYLRVGPTGRKSWIQRITIDGRRREIGLGAYPTVSL